MEQFAAVWNRFFPKQVAASDGRRVVLRPRGSGILRSPHGAVC